MRRRCTGMLSVSVIWGWTEAVKLRKDFKRLFKFFCLFCWAKQHYEILVLGPGNEPVSPALNAWSLNLYKVRNAVLFSSFIHPASVYYPAHVGCRGHVGCGGAGPFLLLTSLCDENRDPHHDLNLTATLRFLLFHFLVWWSRANFIIPLCPGFLICN